ncbi:MAG: AI-2E family transporter [Verrucomicrobia bacterium]|nr:AI-2E family transporter [Verrucomicrobiota bacterium]
MPDQKESGSYSRPLSYADVRRGIGLVFLSLIGLALVIRLESVLVLFAVTVILAMVFNPFVAMLQRRGLNRGLAVALLGLILLALLTAAFSFLLPPFLDQVQQLIQQAPEVWKRVSGLFDQFLKRYPFIQQALPAQPGDLVQAAGAPVSGVAGFLLRSTLSFAGGLVLAALCVLIFIFLLANPQPLVSSYLELIAPRYRAQARRALLRMIEQMSAWARGILINGIITAITTGLLLAWIGIQPAYVFGVFAFFGEFVPIIGPVIVAVPALLVAASIGLSQFSLALLAILFVQQVETNLLIPFVMGKQMDLHPVIIMFFTLVMGTLFGALGAILVVPAAAFLKILIGEFYLYNRREDKRQFDAEALRIVTHEERADR